MEFRPADVSAMRSALELARQSLLSGSADVPVGALVIDAEGRSLASSGNRREALSDPTAHAEVRALRDAASRVGNYRLPGATLYVTLEPCAS